MVVQHGRQPSHHLSQMARVVGFVGRCVGGDGRRQTFHSGGEVGNRHAVEKLAAIAAAGDLPGRVVPQGSALSGLQSVIEQGLHEAGKRNVDGGGGSRDAGDDGGPALKGGGDVGQRSASAS